MSISTPIPTSYSPQQAALAADLAQWNRDLLPLIRARVAADQAVANARAAYEDADVATDPARATYEDARSVAAQCAFAESNAYARMRERIEQYAPDWDAAGQMLAVNRYANSLRCKMALDDDPELPAKLATAEGEMIEFMNVEDTANASELPERNTDHVPLHDDADHGPLQDDTDHGPLHDESDVGGFTQTPNRKPAFHLFTNPLRRLCAPLTSNQQTRKV